MTSIGSSLFSLVPSVAALEPGSSAQVIYTFDSFTDDPAFEGKPCGLLVDSPHGKRVVLGFPLLYLDTATAKGLVNHALQLFGERGVAVAAGDVDGSGEIQLNDLMIVINHLFSNGERPVPFALADVDGSCQVDMADLAYFVDYLFREGPAPGMGCAL